MVFCRQSIVILGIMSVVPLFEIIRLFQSFLNPKWTIVIDNDYILWLLLEPFYMLACSPDLFIILLFVGFICAPLFFAWLIHRKLVEPLNKEIIPNKKTFHFLFGTGSFILILFGTFIAGTGYISGSLLNGLIVGIPFFLIFFIVGVLAIGIVKHELKKPKIGDIYAF